MALRVVVGPPCAGKSTYVRERRAPGEVVVDFDAMCVALGSDEAHDAPPGVRGAALAARGAAIDNVIEAGAAAWVIHTSPPPGAVARYEAAGAEFVALDPGEGECLARAEADGRPSWTAQAIRDWYADPPELPGRKGGRPMRRKEVSVRVKDAVVGEGGGSITAYASTFDREPDSYGDVVARGAFAGSLARHEAEGDPILFLWGHDVSDPFSNIGRVTSAAEDERGLRVTAEFDPDSERAQYVRKLVSEGRVTKLSFAYDVLDEAPVELEDGTKANELRELELYEVSLVAIPANRHAEVVDVKGRKYGRRNSGADEEVLRGVRDALRGAVGDIEGLLGGGDDEGENAEEPATANAEDAKSRDLVARLEGLRL